MNCDSIAHGYRWLEYLSFGSALWTRRCAFLHRTLQSKRVLMLGEGDGRFLGRFMQQNPRAEVDYVDSSTVMTNIARHRSRHAGADNRVRFHTCDIRDLTLSPQNYDVIFSHFFLDCFSDLELADIVGTVAGAAAPGALWVVSEFQLAPAGWRAWRSRAWVAFLYAAFGLVTDLENRRLPDYRSALESNGFRLLSAIQSSAGLLVSELWQRGALKP